jgi:hypothetical protein
VIAVTAVVLMHAVDAQSKTYYGNPNNYLTLLRSLAPGDTLFLEPGVYDDSNDVPGLPFFNLHGKSDKPIVITGPQNGLRPIFWGRSTHNTVRFDNASFIEIHNIEIDGRNLGGDGVKAQGMAHDILLDNLKIYGVGSDQQIVGISTKASAWNWVIRNCVILGAGTGMYLGSSDGSAPFVNGLIEHNLIVNTIGYNLQIKHQKERPNLPGMPKSGTTIIRHNVFSKAENGSNGDYARPTVLVGHWPLAGAGANDVYQIYGNFFYENPNEALFQGEGNIALHHNLFVNHSGSAIHIQPHNDVPKQIHVFLNTVVAAGAGIKVSGGSSSYVQKVIGNAVFASTPIAANDQEGNITDSYQAASSYLANPMGAIGELDLYPKPGKLTGTPINTIWLQNFIDWDRDFNGDMRQDNFRGAYWGEGTNPGRLPTLDIKVLRTPDDTPPSAVMDLRITVKTDTSITLDWTAPGDDGSGGGPAVAYALRYSSLPLSADRVAWFSVATRVVALPMPQAPGSRESVTVKGLTLDSGLTFLLRAIDDVGNMSDLSNPVTTTTLEVDQNAIQPPRQLTLEQNYPNPFNPETTIRYGVASVRTKTPTKLRLIILNLIGQPVRTLVNKELAQGYYEARWDGRDDYGRMLPTGLYLYRLEAGETIVSRKMLLMR